MGAGVIVSGGADGRYTVRLDFGEAKKTALLARVAAAQADLSAKVAIQQVYVAEAQAREAASLAQLNDAQNFLILQMQSDAFASEPAKRLFDQLKASHQKLVVAQIPVHDALKTLRLQLLQAQQMAAAWGAFVASVERPAWCCDLTEDAQGTVATVEIPGEPNLVLIAPGGRAWQGWDRTISTARKSAELARLQKGLERLALMLGDLNADIAAQEAAAVTLKLDEETARLAYAASQSQVNRDAYEAASAALRGNQIQLTNLRFRRAGVVQQIAKVMVQVSAWGARPASDAPVYGDGALTGRQVMSPWQAYLNAALLPGWQKHMPTYRWGTVTGKDETLRTLDVALAPAKSSAQGLDVNKRATLSTVPVEYMTCGVDAFDVGDRVVVKFIDQSWDRPVVIGFVDNPKRCPVKVRYSVRRAFIVDGGGVVPPQPAAFPVGQQGVTWYISGMGYLEGERNLAPGASYAATTFPSSPRHFLVQAFKVVNGVYSYYDSLSVPGGVIAGSDIDIGAQYLYFPETLTLPGQGSSSIHNAGDPIDGDPPMDFWRSYQYFWFDYAHGALISGETVSPITTNQDVADHWVPAVQVWRHTYQEVRNGVILPVLMDVTYTRISGGEYYRSGNRSEPLVVAITGWRRVE